MPPGRRPWLLTGILVAGLLVTSLWSPGTAIESASRRGVAGLSGGLVPGPIRAFDNRPYAGHGTWVDVFDYLPVFQPSGQEPTVTPASIEEMAAAGVETLFIQAGLEDPSTPDHLTDPDLLGRFIVRAHANGLDVVGWYLPRFADADADLRHLLAIDRFTIGGHRFDGVAVDIEFTADVGDHEVRNERLLDISSRLQSRTGGAVLGAIVLPPVLTDVVNPAAWPGFPWAELAANYDVWLPMSYWTTRDEPSGYRDGFSYNEESTRRLRSNLGDDTAVVHGIGGIGDESTPEAIGDFARSLAATESIGGSVYDWNTLAGPGREAMTEAFRSGAASRLPPP
jgi:hypothetical protein